MILELLLADWSQNVLTASLRYNKEKHNYTKCLLSLQHCFKMITFMFLYRQPSKIISVTILKRSFSVWLELTTNQLLKSKLIISEVSTDAQPPWLKQEHVSIFCKLAERIQLRKKRREKIFSLTKYNVKLFK